MWYEITVLVSNCWWPIPRIVTLNRPSIKTICHSLILMTIVFFLCNEAKTAFILLNVTMIFSYNITTNFDIVYAKKLEQVWRLKEDGLTRGNEVTANEEGGSHQSKTRGEICPCRHCWQQCKFFASSVNFSIQQQILWRNKHGDCNFAHFLWFYA